MNHEIPLRVVFYKTETGKEPVREWLRSLSREDRKIIGEDIKTVQFGWPLGMPLVRKLEIGLWEVRSKLPNRIARTIFTVDEGMIVLLHGFIKKSQKTPATDLTLARKRASKLRGPL
jgi:phage-related protein